MAATRENVLSAIVEYVTNNNRRAPAKAIAEMVDDKLPVVQGIIKELIADGVIESSRGRNGGAKPVGDVQASADQSSETEGVTVEDHTDVASQLADLLSELEGAGESQAAVG